MGNPEEEKSPYKLGLFYFNNADKRVMVPKRFGIGWTFNFANIWSYVLLLAIIGIIVFVKDVLLHR